MNGANSNPVEFADDAGKLCVMTGSRLAKCMRIRNNPQVRATGNWQLPVLS